MGNNGVKLTKCDKIEWCKVLLCKWHTFWILLQAATESVL